MTRDVAQELIRQYLQICKWLNEMTDTIERVPDSEEQKRLRRPVGELGASFYTDLIIPIIRQYPDLDPDK